MGIKCLIRRKLRCWHPSHVTWSRDWNEKKLLCDTSFALARSSSTRRYTGKSMVLLGSDCKMKPLIRRQCPWYFGSVLVDFRDIDRLVGIDRIHTTVSLTSRVSACDIPRPAGVWIVTRPRWGGGGQRPPPLRSPKLLDRFSNFKRHSIALYVTYPWKVKNLTRRSLMTSQVRSKSEFWTFWAW